MAKNANTQTMVDEKDFFREATLRLCSSLDIERALHQCLLYASQFTPAGQMGFYIYHPDAGEVETVAMATLAGGEATSIRIPMTAEGRQQIETLRMDRLRMIDRLGDDPVTGPVADRLRVWESSAVVMDLVLERTMLGIFSVFDNGTDRFTATHMQLLGLLDKPCAIALTNFLRYRELKNLKELLDDDNRYYQAELNRMAGETVIGAGQGLGKVMEMVRQVSPLESPVLLLGETGTGKEVIANAIHNLSLRRKGPFIRVNCGAIPASLMDSELFGYEKGAFTGAVARKRGRIERAQGGTLFLDEIGELSAEAQIRLLRVLQEKEIDRVGGTRTIRVNIRIIAATHRNLEKMMAENRFRADLFFRLRVFPIAIPPLRERKDDIPALVEHFILKKVKEMKLGKTPRVPVRVMEALAAYAWPGNVRELENAVERALILDRDGPLFFDELLRSGMGAGRTEPVAEGPVLPLDEVIGLHIRQVLDRCAGRVEGPHGAARLLKVHPSTLRKRMKKLGIPFGRTIGR